MMRRFPAELTRHEEEPDLPGSILSPSQRERRAAGAPGSAGDEGDQEHMHGFNRELRLAERRRSSSGDGSARTPPPAITAISAVVLDDVDGDVLDASPNRVPGSPAQPSPQRLSIPRTPVSARSLLDRSALADSDSGPASVPGTPVRTTAATSVEVLMEGTMRTAGSEWFHAGQAWFPAELLNVHRAPAADMGPHPAFEDEEQEGAAEEQEEVWVQLRVPVMREQPVLWVRIEAVRRVSQGGVLPSEVAQDVEVSQLLDGRWVWYRGRLVAAPPGASPCSPSNAARHPSFPLHLLCAGRADLALD